MDIEISNLVYKFVKENYNYVYLKAMIDLGIGGGQNTTLFTGSSHALNGIDVFCFENAVNCSMHTQDIYYDYCCIRKVLDNIKNGTEIKKCFIIFGYYITFQDLSRGKKVGKKMISEVYYPVFKDKHNYAGEVDYDLWTRYSNVDTDMKNLVETEAKDMLIRRRQYYNELQVRQPFYNFDGKKWKDFTEEKKMEFGKQRAEIHNRQFHFKASYLENAMILSDCVRYLLSRNVAPVIVIPPFTAAYNSFVDQNMKYAVTEMLSNLEYIPDILDFNEMNVGFNDDDFIDTDHLNGRGAYKLSLYLGKKYGR